MSIRHSNKSIEENASEIVWDVDIKIGETEYKSNWAISKIRYDVILGIP